jgi:sodium ion-translocating decarboxylase beta subunit
MNIAQALSELWQSTGLFGFSSASMLLFGWLPGELVMIAVGLLLLYLGIVRGFEPLLLIPIGFGGILANIPLAAISGPEGFLGIISAFGVDNGLFPLLIFMGVGAMTDFGPLIAHPKTALLGAAAQFGIFFTLLAALALSDLIPFVDFSLKEASAISIIGGADGPTAIYVANRLADDLLGAIAVAAYSYMALVPIIQPPIMRLLTTKAERAIRMRQLRPVTRREKILFPLLVLLLCILFLPDATPLIGALMFGNLAREVGVIDRLSETMQNSLINIVTILLGLSVGSKLRADKFLQAETLGILVLGLVAFSIGTAAGVLLGKLMNRLSKEKVNPLIGAAGVSAVPMAARVASKVGQDEDPENILLMHAMGPNVSGVIGSAVAAGILIALNTA